MDTKRSIRIWPPVFYTLVWTIGFFIGIFGFMPDAVGAMKLVVAAFTTYAIFLLTSFLDMWLALVHNLNLRVKPLAAFSLIVVAVMLLATIILSYAYVHSGSSVLFAFTTIIMILSYFWMEYLKANRHLCFLEAVGTRYISKL